jgi:hypothetical protein
MKTAGPVERAALWTHFLVPRTLRVVQLAVETLELAALPDAWADGMTARFYEGATSFQTAELNASGLSLWERAVVERWFPGEGTVLVTSAGGGREALALVERGYRVVAAECTPPLAAALARHLDGRAVALHLPPDAVPAERGPFDAAIIGVSGYTHLIGRERRVDFARRLGASLKPGAPLLVSFTQSPAHSRGARLAAALANAVRRPLGRRLVDVGETTSFGWSRIFAPGEVRAELTDAGLRVIDEGDDGQPWCVATAD